MTESTKGNETLDMRLIVPKQIEFKIPETATLEQVIRLINSLILNVTENSPVHKMIKGLGWTK